jgi:site-specific recombinase XerD
VCAVSDLLPAPMATFSDRAPVVPAAPTPVMVPVTVPPPNLLPAVARPEQLNALQDLVRGFLLSKRSVTTRTAYAADLASWLHWCDQLGVDPLQAGIHHADAYLRVLAEVGDPRTGRTLAAASIARRTSAVHGFYRYAARHNAVAGSPFTGIARPAVDDESMSTGLTREQVHALFTAARAHSPRSEALVRLLVLNGLRISEALGARIEDLGHDRGHRVLTIRRKGGRRAKTPLTPDVQVALDVVVGERGTGPLFTSATGKPLDRTAAWRLLRRLAHDAGLPSADRISPHSARHTYATTALDAGVSLRDVQDSMGHRDPRTTRQYDRSRGNLTRNATYAVAAALAE